MVVVVCAVCVVAVVGVVDAVCFLLFLLPPYLCLPPLILFLFHASPSLSLSSSLCCSLRALPAGENKHLSTDSIAFLCSEHCPARPSLTLPSRPKKTNLQRPPQRTHPPFSADPTICP